MIIEKEIDANGNEIEIYTPETPEDIETLNQMVARGEIDPGLFDALSFRGWRQ